MAAQSREGFARSEAPIARLRSRVRSPCPRNVVGLAFAAAILAACASATYNFTIEELVLDPLRLADSRTFTLYQADEARTDDETTRLVEREIREALVLELSERGWTQAPTRDDADVVVAHAITSAEGSRLVSDISIGRYATYQEDAERELAYVDQALVVDVFSWPEGDNIWRGRAIARLYGPLGESRSEVIDQAVAQIVGQLDDDL